MAGDPQIGRVLDGRYELVRLIGRGGMGAVYEAVHRELDKRVAIKMLLAAAAASREAHTRFLREARAASKLDHPHIVEVTDFGHSEAGEPFLVMEYLEGEDLHHVLARAGRLPLARAAPVLQKVFSAMQVAHQGGIIHRDLKPQNVFLCRYANLRDFPKVLDFGISKILDAATTLTTPDSHIGTPEFMAPEQAKGLSLAADPRTDVFALGAILYRTLGGAAPFGGDTPLAVFYNVVHTEPRPLRELCPTLPEPVAAVVRRALAKEPADRFDSVAALSAAFCGAVGLPDEAAIIGAAASGPPARAPAIETRPDDNNQMGFQSTLGSASGEKLEAAPAATATRGRAGGPRARKVAVLAIVGGLLAAVALGALGLRILQRGAPAVKPATAPPPPEDLGVLDAARAAGAADAARDRAPDRARPTPKTAATKRRKHRTSRPKARDTKAEPGPAPRRPADEKDVDY